jgi:hypothetical protein
MRIRLVPVDVVSSTPVYTFMGHMCDCSAHPGWPAAATVALICASGPPFGCPHTDRMLGSPQNIMKRGVFACRANLGRLAEAAIDFELLETVVLHIDATQPEGAILVFLPGAPLILGFPGFLGSSDGGAAH